MPESTQHKLDRVRPPRVQITYDVETLGSIVKTELPFVVGIMADLSKESTNKATMLKDRKFVEIDRDNFNQIMEKIEPKVTLKANTGIAATLTFKKLEDFNPINVLRSVKELSDKFDSRTRLANLVAKLDGNPKLQADFLNAYYELKNNAEAKGLLEAYYHEVTSPAETQTTPDQTSPSAKPGQPLVTGATTTKRATALSGLVIKPAAADAEKDVHFVITEVKGGTLSKKDGTAIDATTKAVITRKEGEDGLTFTPDKAATAGDGSFTVQASTSATDDVLSDPLATTITVTK